MLQLTGITKEYLAGENTVHALRGIDLQLRKNEFVAILGPSGCGKTTMLNIIGGLDQYTTGDLIINGKSTKDFKDRDWDAYRNYSIGFVFQSYNLIPHQTVLANVELALALSGVSKAERRARAIKALESVGLSQQIHKKPGEMSGGQMQRVAIARALVNNPDIILADEPTGALDSETSVQVMDILKEVAKDRLVIMVTHNPDLAKTYATRTVKMLDGLIIDDSMPLTAEELQKEKQLEKQLIQTENPDKKQNKKPKMSLATSFMLSLKNLFTKKGRTTLTAFAGSIGIIGIALIYAVSQGMTNYIDIVQEETLASYPLTLQAEHTDMGDLMQSFIDSAQVSGKHDKDQVYEKMALASMVKALNSMQTKQNDLKSFKSFLEEERDNSESTLSTALSGVQYSYDFDMLIYTESVDNTIIRSDLQEVMSQVLIKYMGGSLANMMDAFSSNSMTSMFASSMGIWQELLPGDNGKTVNPILEKQYELAYGNWPTNYNDIVVVLDKNNEIDDMTLYALGLKSEEDIKAIMESALNKTPLETESKKWTYQEICNRNYRTILNADCYEYDETTDTYFDVRNVPGRLRALYNDALNLNVTGIIRPKQDAMSPMLTGSIAYTYKLTEYIINNAKDSPVVQAQKDNQEIDIFTGLPFKENAGLSQEDKKAKFLAYVNTLDTKGKAKAYVTIQSTLSKEELATRTEEFSNSMTLEQKKALFISLLEQQDSFSAKYKVIIEEMEEEPFNQIFQEIAPQIVKAQYAQGVQQGLQGATDEQLAALLDAEKDGYTLEQYALYYEEVLQFSENSYEGNLRALGYVDLDSPSSIHLYASTFEAKDVIEKAIKDYNKEVDEDQKITYTDYVGLLMSSVTTIIDAITYVLISFVAVSLIVSSIMIGVITLISVQERTKEIGILRAIGASKRNVSSMFNAETVMIGFASGMLGVGVTYLLCIPINLILHALTGIPNLNAYLPPLTGIILIVISVLLTLIAGIIPSRSAAKKDPVVALRTE